MTPNRNDLERETAGFFHLHWNETLLGRSPSWVEIKPPYSTRIEYRESCGCHAILENHEIVRIGSGGINNIPLNYLTIDPETRSGVLLILVLGRKVGHLGRALAEYLNLKLSPRDERNPLFQKILKNERMPENAIFMALPRGKLREELERLAEVLNCNLYTWDGSRENARANLSDLGFYVAIIDRRHFGENEWLFLEEKYARSDDQSAFILIDNLDPSLLSIHHFRNYDENDLEAQRHILEIVSLLHQLVHLGKVA